MKSWMVVAAIAGLLALPACVSSNPTNDTVRTASSSGSDSRNLPAQALDKGQCGLFLWSVSGEPSFIFFSRAGSRNGKVMIDGAERPIDLVGTSGEVFGQFQAEQRWASPDTGHMVDLSVEPGEEVIAGQSVSGGRLTLIDSAGWETIIPVAGMAGCQEDVPGGPESVP